MTKSTAQFLQSTIMGVAKWERDLWWLSLFCESVKEFDHFIKERSPSIDTHRLRNILAPTWPHTYCKWLEDNF